MVNTFLTYNKIHEFLNEGITVDNAKHAGSTQPLLFSNLVKLAEGERPEWAWINGDDDE